MRFSAASFSVLGLCLHAKAQSLNATGLVTALQGAGLTSLAAAAEKVIGTKAGQALLSALVSGGNYTVFAPDNAAFDAPDISNDPEVLAAVLSYHVLPGYFANISHNASSLDSGVNPSVTVGRTLLTNSTFTNLEGDKGQVVAWTRNDTNSGIFFLNQSPQINVLNTTVVDHILVAVISGILTPPKGLADVAKASNLTALTGFVDIINIPHFFANGSNATAEQALEANSTRGYTLFAPDNAALQEAGSSLSGLANNQTALLTLLGNHYINGTSLYSPELVGGSSNSEFVSASGQTFSFNSNSSGLFVTSQNGASAKVVKSDVLVDNGVVHVIDRVLVNLNLNESKASSAYQSATSAAAQSHTQTGPIGPTSTSSTNSTGGTHSGHNGAVAVSAGVVGAVGWLVFLGLVLVF